MQNITDSWISNTIGCSIIQELFADAARNVPEAYSSYPWNYPGLNHGTAVLTDNVQLDCYVHAYGRMHVYKMWKALESLPLDALKDGFEIVDWGCGQAIASLTLLAWLEKKCPEFATPHKVTLLDLSEVALYRAKSLVERRLLGQSVDIEAVSTDLGAAICAEEARKHSAPVVVHLLSNIIDVQSVRKPAIAEAINASASRHYVVCVGHHATKVDADSFQGLLDAHGVQLLHRENVQYGAILNTGKLFGWDITIMQCKSVAMAA